MPEGWTNIIQNRPEMFSIEHAKTNMQIVFKNTSQPSLSPTSKAVESHPIDVTASLNKNSSTNNTNNIDFNETVELATQKLPWHESQWAIDVTWVLSTVDVWGCIVDSDDYVSRFSFKLKFHS